MVSKLIKGYGWHIMMQLQKLTWICSYTSSTTIKLKIESHKNLQEYYPSPRHKKLKEKNI